MKVKSTAFDWICDGLSILILVGISLFLLVKWPSIPAKIPMHYDASGAIDRYGTRSELVVVPIIAWILYGSMTALGFFPQVWNTGVRVTEENRERVYRTLKHLMSSMKLVLVVIFSYLTVNSLLGCALPVWFMPVFIVLILGVLLCWILRLVKIK
jgi:uncharacterized membrane protein